MTLDPSSLEPAPLSRRGLLRTGTVTVSLGALVAACGSDSGAPGRVGNAPTVTPMPDADVDDAVLLRTATSLEYSAIDLYARLGEVATVDGAGAELMDRIVEDHTRHAEALAELTTAAGGEAYECANSWVADRVIEPLLERIAGDEAEALEPSDDPVRDALGLAYAFESMLGATYQQMVAQLTTPDLRSEAVAFGAEQVRHAAAIAILRDGAPEAYVSPTLSGGTIDLAATDGAIPLFAVPGRFASLAPVELSLGRPNEAGTRFTTSLQTPAENTFVYADQTCPA